MEDKFRRAKDGRVICPQCSKPINSITQAYYDCFEWDENLRKYYKVDCPGSSQNPVCSECGEYLDSKHSWLLHENER